MKFTSPTLSENFGYLSLGDTKSFVLIFLFPLVSWDIASVRYTQIQAKKTVNLP